LNFGNAELKRSSKKIFLFPNGIAGRKWVKTNFIALKARRECTRSSKVELFNFCVLVWFDIPSHHEYNDVHRVVEIR